MLIFSPSVPAPGTNWKGYGVQGVAGWLGGTQDNRALQEGPGDPISPACATDNETGGQTEDTGFRAVPTLRVQCWASVLRGRSEGAERERPRPSHPRSEPPSPQAHVSFPKPQIWRFHRILRGSSDTRGLHRGSSWITACFLPDSGVELSRTGSGLALQPRLGPSESFSGNLD